MNPEYYTSPWMSLQSQPWANLPPRGTPPSAGGAPGTVAPTSTQGVAPQPQPSAPMPQIMQAPTPQMPPSPLGGGLYPPVMQAPPVPMPNVSSGDATLFDSLFNKSGGQANTGTSAPGGGQGGLIGLLKGLF